MGREAECRCQVGSEVAQAKALLETGYVQLRGAIRRRYERPVMRNLRVDGERLCFLAGQEPVALELGAEEAGRWLKKLNTPAPTLAAKLGIGPDNPAWVHGTVEDSALVAALQGATTPQATQAGVMLAVARSADELAAALQAHAGQPALPLWIAHPKGKGASLGDAEVRSTLRAAGYVDSKSTAVSDALTATRYGLR